MNSSRCIPTAVRPQLRRAPPHSSAVKQSVAIEDENTNSKSDLSPDELALHRNWAVKRGNLERILANLIRMHHQLVDDKSATLDAIDNMLIAHDEDVEQMRAREETLRKTHAAALQRLRQHEDACLATKDQSIEEIERLQRRIMLLGSEQETLQESIVMERDVVEQLKQDCQAEQARVRQQQEALNSLRKEEEQMQDATFGLTGEVREMVLEMEALQRHRKEASVTSMELEVTRRNLFSQCEELKGAIRVFCRVKWSTPPSAIASAVREDGMATPSCPATPAKPLRTSTGSSASISSSAFGLTMPLSKPQWRKPQRKGASPNGSPIRGGATAASDKASSSLGEDEHQEDIYSFPLPPRPRHAAAAAAEEEEEEDPVEAEAYIPRTIEVHLSRANSTSTGVQNTTESFTYDRVFSGCSTQTEVYAEVEPLVNSAVDGYHVCVFAYGQTGSGKTYTMEGIVNHPEVQGIAPRALRTVFARVKELAKEGWAYTLRCSLVEIYNDILRDLLQSPAIYEPRGPAAGNSAYHTIKHHPANATSAATTTISNLHSREITSMEDFSAVYRQASQNRRTAKTQLNDRSSRSHCVFTLHIEGVNSTIRQRSQGVLCLVDLAGSERVNESGVQGQQLKEAININRSLLDLGKCIHALRAGTVVPWRNSRLTFLLQNYLGAKGSKTLMVVTVSDRRAHLPESINSLRFASRVNDTVIGTSIKRVTNF